MNFLPIPNSEGNFVGNNKFFSCFDSPDYYDNKWQFHHDGGSPKILKFFTEYILNRSDNIEEINICLYLFNNMELHNILQIASESGAKVNVISIPLEGYDKKNPKQIINRLKNIPSYSTPKSKYDLAVPIYKNLSENKGENYTLYIFPHMYIRSSRTRQFSRGDLPYSLHAKSLLIKFKDGRNAIGLTSSNLAVRDIVKEENIIIIEDRCDNVKNHERFFTDLISQSIPVWEFDETQDWKQYNIDLLEQLIDDKSFFISPFYKDSPFIAERKIIEEIKKAQERILISSQHLAAYKFEYPTDFSSSNPGGHKYNNGFLAEVLKKASEGVKVVCLSQTFVDPNGSTQFISNSGDEVAIREPKNVSKFREFIKKFIQYDNTNYMVNSDIHSKYIIIDDTLLLTTCNFTPTQFIYIDDVQLPNIGYRGIFSEVGHYLLIKDKKIVKEYYNHFRSYWTHPNSIRYK